MSELPDTLQEALIATAIELSDVARRAILPYFRARDLAVENKGLIDKSKGDFDPVTAADRAGETAMRAVLARVRPDDGILGEEFAPVAGTSGWTWVLDPIDGTRAFMSGTPTWGVLIAASNDAGPALGVIDQPFIGERFLGGFGQAHVEGPHGTQPLKTRGPRDLSDAVLFTTFPEVGSETERRAFHALSGHVQLTRYGMDCYAYALLAAGQIDLVVEAGLAAYDVHAPIAVIEAAGGIVTDWKGNPAHAGGRVLAAANAHIHAQALKVLSQAPD